MTKPLLADDWCEDRIQFPLIAQPKIDGVRALNMLGTFTGRSLKKFGNRYITTRFSHSALIGFDGEVAAEANTNPDLCRLTTSALASHNGEPYIVWWLFDYVTPETRQLPYGVRFERLQQRIDEIRCEAPHLYPHLRQMPWRWIGNMDELLEYDELNLAQGFEGTILRDPSAPHKEGRSGKKPILWRIKRFVDFEFRVHTIIEGDENTNEAQINELGHQFRSTHQANMVPNGMIGAMVGNVIGVVRDPTSGDVLFNDGDEVRVGAGRLTHAQRKHFFDNQSDFMSRIHKGKFFPKGIKDKPRFPTWQTFRDPADIS